MNTTPKLCVLLVLVVFLAAAAGCLDPSLRMIPQARTAPPPYAFNESGAFSWQVVWGKSQSAFARSISSMTRKGFRLHDLEVYRDEDATRFAGIFLKDSRRGQVRWRRTRS